MIDINHVDFNALKRAGYNAVVIDKDNCLVRHLLSRYGVGLMLDNTRDGFCSSYSHCTFPIDKSHSWKERGKC